MDEEAQGGMGADLKLDDVHVDGAGARDSNLEPPGDGLADLVAGPP